MFLFSTPSMFAETIIFKSGKTVEGKILNKSSESIKVDIEGVPVTYFIDEIESIDGENISSAAGAQLNEESGPSDIEVVGSVKFIDQVKRALVLIRDKAPDGFITVKKYIGRIEESDHSGMGAYLVPPTFHFSGKSAFYSLTWCAGDIAHDAYHSKLYNDYKEANGEPVPDSVWMGKDIEIKCLKYQSDILEKIGAPKNEIEYVKSLDGSYAEIEYNKRNW